MPSLRSGSLCISPRLRYAIVPLLVMAALGASAGSAVAHKLGEVEIVRQGAFPAPEEIPSNTHYFHKIQEAVEATQAHGWVLIEPGVYDEEVKVTKPTPGIWIRGMNRNTVILDGRAQTSPDGRQRHRNLQGEQRLGGKPHRRATSNAKTQRSRRQRDLVERRRRLRARSGAHGWYGSLPDRL